MKVWFSVEMTQKQLITNYDQKTLYLLISSLIVVHTALEI